MAIDLSKLSPPQSIDVPSFEGLYQENLGFFLKLNPDYSALTEADPVVKLIQMFTYKELILRFLLNDVAASNLLALATGTDLEHIAIFYGVERLTIQEEDLTTIPIKEKIMENDDDFRQRTLDRVGGWANAGGADHYRYWAKTASSQVKDASVYSPIKGLVKIAILSRATDGVPTADVLTDVIATVTRKDIKVLTDTVEVIPAVKKSVKIEANVILQSDAPIAVYDTLAYTFDTQFAANVKLGWDLTESWVKKILHQEGVYKVTLTKLNTDNSSTVSDVITNDEEYCSYNLILTYGGRNS